MTLENPDNDFDAVAANATAGSASVTDKDGATVSGSAGTDFTAPTVSGDLVFGTTTAAGTLKGTAEAGSIDLTSRAVIAHSDGITMAAAQNIKLADGAALSSSAGDISLSGRLVAPGALALDANTVRFSGGGTTGGAFSITANDLDLSGATQYAVGTSLLVRQKSGQSIGFGDQTGAMSISQSELDLLKAPAATFATTGDAAIGKLVWDGAGLPQTSLLIGGTLRVAGALTGTSAPDIQIGAIRGGTAEERPDAVIVEDGASLGADGSALGDIAFNVEGDVLIGSDSRKDRGATIFKAGNVRIDVDGDFTQKNTGIAENLGLGADLGVVTIANASSVALFGSVISATTGVKVSGTNAPLGVALETTPSNKYQINGCVIGEVGACTPFGGLPQSVELDEDMLSRIFFDISDLEMDPLVADRGNEEWWRPLPDVRETDIKEGSDDENPEVVRK